MIRLLQKYEHSTSYGRPSPWARDIIVKNDARTFPEAFAVDGREQREALLRALDDLEHIRAIRVTRHARGPLAGEVKELRLGPNEVEAAYREAPDFERLSVGLEALCRHAEILLATPSAQWMQDHCRSLAAGAEAADLSAVGMSRERFKDEWRSLLPALTVASALAAGIHPAWERVASERILGDSKALGRVRSLVIDILLRADPRWQGVPLEEASGLLEAYGVRRKPALIRCAGAGSLTIGPREYRLEDFVPAAHLPEQWSDAWVAAICQGGVQQVTTIENEYPFLSYIEEAGGPQGLSVRKEIAVFTAGFPTPALMSALKSLSEKAPSISFRHWGDADVGGIRIWWFLRSRLRRHVSLFRTTGSWLKKEAVTGGKALTNTEHQALRRLATDLQDTAGDDIAQARELIATLLESGVKVEQERF